MSGTLALVGSGEFTAALERVDRELLAATGRQRPRVAILPTASAPDGEQVFLRWAEMGRDHFTRLGAEVEPVLVRNATDANDPCWAQAVGEADFIYLSGGKPNALRRALDGTQVGRAIVAAHDRGIVIAGSSAGAIVLGGILMRFRRRPRLGPPRIVGWERALGLVPGIAVVPHYNAVPEALLVLSFLQAPRGTTVVGIDEDTAFVGRDGTWQVMGAGRVTLWRGRHRARYREGDIVRL
jgi:cyanophycinase